MKKAFYVIFGIFLTAFAVSCQNDDERTCLPEKPADEFADVCKASFSSLADLDVRTNGNGPRKSFAASADSTQTIYVKPNPDLGPAGDLKPFPGTTLKDLLGYLEFANAEWSMTPDGTVIDSVNISVEEAKKSMKPLVTESYKYLQKEYGFSESDLKTLVADNHTTEEALVLLMLTLKEYNGNVSAGFCSPPNPNDKTKPAEDAYLKRAAGCALEAIGVSVVEQLIEGIIEAGIRNVSKAVIIKVFKKIASRYCNSVVGITLAALDWARCMNYI